MRLKAICVELPSSVYGRAVTLMDESRGLTVAHIQTGVSMCCGMNTLFGFNLAMLDTPVRVKEFFDDLAQQPWKRDTCIGRAPHYDTKHYIFTCGMGPYGMCSREEAYKALINDPRVKLINRDRSISEPGEGHDIGIFFVDLSKVFTQ